MRPVRDDALHRVAALPGVRVPACDEGGRRPVEVRVLVDEVRRVATELEQEPLERRRGVDRPAASTPPVNEMRPAGRRRPGARLVSPFAGRTLIAAGGNPTSRRRSAIWSAHSGAWWAGLTTTALPAASAGATLCITRLKGALNGETAATMPSGSRMRRRQTLPTGQRVGSRDRLAQLLDRGRRPREGVGRAVHLAAGVANRLAGLAADRRRVQLLALADQVRRAAQLRGPLVDGHRRQVVDARRRGDQRPVHASTGPPDPRPRGGRCGRDR